MQFGISRCRWKSGEIPVQFIPAVMGDERCKNHWEVIPEKGSYVGLSPSQNTGICSDHFHGYRRHKR